MVAARSGAADCPCNDLAKYEVVRRLNREGVRAIAASPGIEAHARRIRDAGLNTCVTWAYMLRHAEDAARTVDDGRPWVTEHDVGENLDRLGHDMEMAARHDLVYLPNLWLHQDTAPFFRANPSYRRCVTVTGTRTGFTPCPVDEGYWDRLMLPMLKMIAAKLRWAGCDGGATLDLEFYVGDFSGGYCYDATALQGCYCDHCFGRFLEAQGSTVTADRIGIGDRVTHVAAHYSRDVYLAFLEDLISRKARSVADEVRRLKFDFLFGFMPGIEHARDHPGLEHWYLRGIARGLSAPDLPVFVFGEKYGGYNPQTAADVAWLREQAFPTYSVGGLMIGRFTGAGIGAHAAELMDQADGYWLYFGQELLRSERRRGSNPAHWVLEPYGLYWDALTASNRMGDDAAWRADEEILGEIPLFTAPAIASKSDSVRIDPDRVVLPAAAERHPGLVNGQFDDPLETGWTIRAGRPRIVVPLDRAGLVLYCDFGPVGARQRMEVSQVTPVVPGARYIVKMEVRTEDIAYADVGISIHDGAGFHSDRRTFHESSGWQTLELQFVPRPSTRNLAKITCFATGHGGRVWIDDVRIHRLIRFDVEVTAPLLPKDTRLSRLIMPSVFPYVRVAAAGAKGGPSHFEKLMSETGGRIDLRYLSAIDPGAAARWRLRMFVPESEEETSLPPGRLEYARATRE
ncbi:MAG: hypothetical protein CMJ18_27005 [Phycisphaeraceae bacterium]|nr:hypothetical protein [Phycisphaeraceae bacterium]